MREKVILALSAPSPSCTHFVLLFSITFWAGDFGHFFRLKSLLDLGDKMTPYPFFNLKFFFFSKYESEKNLIVGGCMIIPALSSSQTLIQKSKPRRACS